MFDKLEGALEIVKHHDRCDDVRLLGMTDLKVVDVALCYAMHKDCQNYNDPTRFAAIDEVRRKEFDLELDADQPYCGFQERIERHRQELNKLLKDLKRSGKSVQRLWGLDEWQHNSSVVWNRQQRDHMRRRQEPGKGWGPHDRHRNSDRIRGRIPGMNPNYYLVLPWHFREEFVQREAETLARGTKFIFPLPQIQIVGG
jgi:hypothetical protein